MSNVFYCHEVVTATFKVHKKAGSTAVQRFVLLLHSEKVLGLNPQAGCSLSTWSLHILPGYLSPTVQKRKCWVNW